MSAATQADAEAQTETNNHSDSSNDFTRQVAARVLASEVNAVEKTFKSGDADRAPRLAALPSGALAGRVLIVGTLVANELRETKNSTYRSAKIIAPDEPVYVNAGEYQKEAQQALADIDAPAYVAVVGKVETYDRNDGSVGVNIRPESVTEVDGDTRDRWVVDAIDKTLDRAEHFQAADPSASDDRDVVLTRQFYGQDHDASPFIQNALDAAEELQG